MFGHRFFASRFFAPRYYPPVSTADTSTGGRLIGALPTHTTKINYRDTARTNAQRNQSARTRIKRG